MTETLKTMDSRRMRNKSCGKSPRFKNNVLSGNSLKYNMSGHIHNHLGYKTYKKNPKKVQMTKSFRTPEKPFSRMKKRLIFTRIEPMGQEITVVYNTGRGGNQAKRNTINQNQQQQQIQIGKDLKKMYLGVTPIPIVPSQQRGSNRTLINSIPSLINQFGYSSSSFHEKKTREDKDPIQDLEDVIFLGKNLGKGSFGEVRLAKPKNKKELLAIKTFKNAKIKDAKAKENFEQEIRILKKVKHEAIPSYKGYFEDSSSFHLATSFAGKKTLFNACRNLTEPKLIKSILRQLAEVIEYLHNNDIAHRDIKLKNIAYKQKKEIISLLDYGFAIDLSKKKVGTSICGTPLYMAPELQRVGPYDPRAVDVWAFGVVAFKLATKQYPFKVIEGRVHFKDLENGVYSSSLIEDEYLLEVVQRCFEVNPLMRFGISDILGLYYFSDF